MKISRTEKQSKNNFGLAGGWARFFATKTNPPFPDYIPEHGKHGREQRFPFALKLIFG